MLIAAYLLHRSVNQLRAPKFKLTEVANVFSCGGCMRVDKNAIQMYSKQKQAGLSDESLNSKHQAILVKPSSSNKAKDAAAFADILKRAMAK
jgi:hypothetical protein